MADIIKKIEEVVEYLEQVQRDISLEDNEFNKALEKFALKAMVTINSIDEDNLGFQIKSIVLKPESGENNVVFNPVAKGVSAYPELREQILPNINMTNLIFSHRTTAHRACFYIAKDNKEILNYLKEEKPPSQALLLEYDEAVPFFIKAWLEKWKKIPTEEWTPDNIRENCLRDLSAIINQNIAAFEAHGIKSIILASRPFPGALQVQNLNCVDYLSQSKSKKEKLLWGYYSDENKGPQDLEDSGKIAFPNVSRTNFWWNMYMAKCSLNTDQYSLFCSNPSTRGDSYAGVVVISDLSSDCNKIPVALLAIDLIAGTLLSCVDRMTLAYVEKERFNEKILRERSDARNKQHVQMIRSFGHDAKEPARIIATLLSKPWKHTSQVAKILTNSLVQRLISYSRLSSTFKNSEKAIEILKEEAKNASSEERERVANDRDKQDDEPYLIRLCDVFFEESIGLFGKIAVDDAGVRIANKLWGNDKQKEVFEYVFCTDTESTEQKYFDTQVIINRLSEKNIIISCEDEGYRIPRILSGARGKPTTPLLATVLHFVFAELFTNTLRYQWMQSVSSITKLKASLTVEINEEAYLVVRFSPGFKPKTILPEDATITGLTSLKLALLACGTRMNEYELKTVNGTIGTFPWPIYENNSTFYKIGPIDKLALVKD